MWKKIDLTTGTTSIYWNAPATNQGIYGYGIDNNYFAADGSGIPTGAASGYGYGLIGPYEQLNTNIGTNNNPTILWDGYTPIGHTASGAFTASFYTNYLT